jgi:hypothetical protein
MELANGTPFAAERFVEVDKDAAEQLIVVAKGTWMLDDDGKLVLAEEQPPPSPIDEFHGEPDASSIAHEVELGPVKPATEVLVTGHAVARRPNTRAMDVRVTVGKVRKTVRVFGERHWEKKLGVVRATDAEPFDRVALVWENAFGGVDETPKEKHRAGEARNPVGRGFRAKGTQLPVDGELLPSLEDPRDAVGKPGRKGTPACFAPICRHWVPRRDYAGTYDQKWLDEVFPFLPKDFDERFHHAAPPDQIARGYLKGGEPAELIGLTREGKSKFALPSCRPTLSVRLRARTEEVPMVLETVGFDTGERALRVIWKGRMRIHGEFPELRKMTLGLEGEV